MASLNHNHIPDSIQKKAIHTGQVLKKEEKIIAQAFKNRRRAAFHRFPLLFTMLSTFGLVTTFYGFEHIIDKIPFLTENPHIMLAIGIAVLLITGTIYSILSHPPK